MAASCDLCAHYVYDEEDDFQNVWSTWTRMTSEDLFKFI